MLLKAAIAAATFLLAYSRRGDFWKAVALSALAQYVISGLQPLPYVFSILFFAVRIAIALEQSAFGIGAPALLVAGAVRSLGQSAHPVRSGVGLARSVPGRSVVEHWLRALNVRWLSSRIVPLPLIQVSTIAVLCAARHVCDAVRFPLAAGVFEKSVQRGWVPAFLRDGFDELSAAAGLCRDAAGDDGLSGSWPTALAGSVRTSHASRRHRARVSHSARCVAGGAAGDCGAFEDVPRSVTRVSHNARRCPDGNGARLQWRRRWSW